jgi:hypothetical protein
MKSKWNQNNIRYIQGRIYKYLLTEINLKKSKQYIVKSKWNLNEI